MFHALKTPSNALSILRGVPRPPRRDILPTQLTSTALRSHTTYAYVLNNLERTRRSKWTRRIIYGLLFGGAGYYAGKALILDWCFPPLPGSRMDVEQMKQIRLLLDGSSTTRQLRLDPKFVEWEAYEGVSTGDKEKRLTSGPLKGSRGLAVQKIFWNEEDKICVNILHFGKTLEGWPTIVHGGLLATVLDETLGRVAIRSVPAQTGVTAHLDVTYKASVYAGEPYMITACLDKERSTDRKAYVTGEIRDTSGKVCCEAEALFVVPKGMPLRNIVELF